MFLGLMSEIRIEATRGSVVESVHRVSVAVVDADDRLLASAGNPDLVTFWRSAAKPFQALPLVQDGAADRFGLSSEEIAISCASHSSEPVHLGLVDRYLAKVGITEADLACGPHPPLSEAVAEQVIRAGTTLTPRWSNCSGKHTGLVAQAKHRDWPIAGYERLGHPVQTRILEEVERFTGLRRGQLALGVDGCTTVCYGLPVRRMALAYARFGASEEPAAKRIFQAMSAHPHLVAGTGRLCTDLMRAWPGAIVAKVGADGVYSAAIPSRRLGIALKVEDGDGPSAALALLAVLAMLLENDPPPPDVENALGALLAAAAAPVRNTRGAEVGQVRVHGRLRFSAP
jgi:L-asparaginase II